MRKYPWLHRPVSSLFTHSCTLPGRPEVVGTLPIEWNTANKNPTTMWGSKGRWMQPPDAGCERDPATSPLSHIQSFRTGHHSSALKLITPSPAAVMPRGKTWSTAHTQETKPATQILPLVTHPTKNTDYYHQCWLWKLFNAGCCEKFIDCKYNPCAKGSHSWIDDVIRSPSAPGSSRTA